MKNSSALRKYFLIITGLALQTGCAKMEFSQMPATAQEAPQIEEPPTPRSISKTEFVGYGNKKVDFLLVLDDSFSMLPELKKLSSRMSGFMASLEASNLDWQMCVTTTRGSSVKGRMEYGTPLIWKNYKPLDKTPPYLLRKGSANLHLIFTSTIDQLTIGGGYSGDERGIKAAYESFKTYEDNNCYREGAAISVILISDEDVRSVGGKRERLKKNDSASALQPIEPEDQPENLVMRVKSSFGAEVRFTFNSIIVKPNDNICEQEQDKDTSPSHSGDMYHALSILTDGGVGSICDTDYGSNLNTFKNKIVNSLSTLTLECEPEIESIDVRIDDAYVSGVKLDGKNLKFSYPLIEGTKVDIRYDCKKPL